MFSFVQNQEDWTGTVSFKVRALNSGEDWIPDNSDDMSLDSNLFSVTVLPVNSKPSFWDNIPGFPYESIILGLLTGAFVFWLLSRRKMTL